MTARKHNGAACPITQPRSQPDGYSSWSSASFYNWTWLSSSRSIDLHFPPEVPAGLIEAPQDFKIVAAITTEKQPAQHCLLSAGATQLTVGGTAFPGCLLTWHCPSCTEISICSRGETTRGKKTANTVGITPTFVESKTQTGLCTVRNVDQLLLNSFKNCPEVPFWFLVAVIEGNAVTGSEGWRSMGHGSETQHRHQLNSLLLPMHLRQSWQSLMGVYSAMDEVVTAPGAQATRAKGGCETGVKALQSWKILCF